MKKSIRIRTMIGGGLLGAAALLSACTVVVDDRPPPGPRPDPICTREYAPVCGRRGGDRQTFANACLARASGYRIVRPGTCRGGAGPGPGPRPPQICTREYAPVCARRGPNVRTFGNSCEARAAEYRILYRGPCD